MVAKHVLTVNIIHYLDSSLNDMNVSSWEKYSTKWGSN